jgi:hypothetical protein
MLNIAQYDNFWQGSDLFVRNFVSVTIRIINYYNLFQQLWRSAAQDRLEGSKQQMFKFVPKTHND